MDIIEPLTIFPGDSFRTPAAASAEMFKQQAVELPKVNVELINDYLAFGDFKLTANYVKYASVLQLYTLVVKLRYFIRK